MTPKELAAEAATKWNANSPGHFPGRPLLEGLVTRAVELAIRQERERCRAVARELCALYVHESPAKTAAVARVMEGIGPDDEPSGPW